MKLVICVLLVFAFLGTISATTIFYDGFESGNLNEWILSSAYNGTNWTANQTNPYAGNWDAQSNPRDNHAEASVIQRSVSTVGYHNITFSYYRKLIGLDSYPDKFRVKWYDGTSWDVLEQTSSVSDVNYSLRTFNLPSSADNNSDFKIKFDCNAQSTSEYCRVDDVLVTGQPIVNYVGSFEYMPGQTYSVFIDQSASDIVFVGQNISNQNSVFVVPFNAQGFSKRVNYVWFNGWFDNQSLYLNQYVGTGAQYSGAASQSSPGVYNGQVTLPNSVYVGINSAILLNISVDYNNYETIFNPVSFPGMQTNSYIDSAWSASGHAYGPVLYQSKILPNGTIEVSEWVKEDLALNGMTPRWTVPLTPA